jgi:hypothetical protein
LDDVAELPYAEMIELIRPFDADGNPIPVERMPGGVALIGRRPQHTTIWMHDLQGGAHWCAVTSLPLDNQGGDSVGAMSIVWELDGSREVPPVLP